jgi:hypothetical protein
MADIHYAQSFESLESDRAAADWDAVYFEWPGAYLTF